MKFSVEQLLQCLPKYENIEECSGVHPKELVLYLMEVGLVEEGKFTDCNSINPADTYRFSPIYPESPNAGGLMNLVAEGRPVFVMVSLELARLRFVKNMDDKDIPLKCGDFEPSMYGVVTGYNYDEVMIEDSYWEIASHIVGSEGMKVRIPMTANMTNGNYGGIAAFAFTLESETRNTKLSVNEEKYPSIDSIPDYVIDLIFEGNSYPDLSYLDLSRFTELQTVEFRNGSFANADSLYINNPYLKKITFGDHCFNGKYENQGRRLLDVWYDTHNSSLTIKDGRKLELFNVGEHTMENFESIRIIHLWVNMEISIGSDSLYSVLQIEIPVIEYSDGNYRYISDEFTKSILEANKGMELIIETIEFIPSDDELDIPTYPPSDPSDPVNPVDPSDYPKVPHPSYPLCDENNENHFITYDEYCEQLRETHWECIQINMGSCNEMKGELSISNYPNLKTFVIDQDALTNLTSLIVSNNPQLTQFETWYWANEDSASLKFVENLVIESM